MEDLSGAYGGRFVYPRLHRVLLIQRFLHTRRIRLQPAQCALGVHQRSLCVGSGTGDHLISELDGTADTLTGNTQALQDGSARDKGQRVGQRVANQVSGSLAPAFIHAADQIAELGIIFRAADVWNPVARDRGINNVTEEVNELTASALKVTLRQIANDVARITNGVTNRGQQARILGDDVVGHDGLRQTHGIAKHAQSSVKSGVIVDA